MGVNEFIKIGTKIKTIRKSKGITQKEMAAMLDIPYSTYSNYENNNREPNRETLENIAKQLDVSISEIIIGPKLLQYEILQILQKSNIDFLHLSKNTSLDYDDIEKCLTNSRYFFEDDLLKIALYIGLPEHYVKTHLDYDAHELLINQNYEELSKELRKIFHKWADKPLECASNYHRNNTTTSKNTMAADLILDRNVDRVEKMFIKFLKSLGYPDVLLDTIDTYYLSDKIVSQIDLEIRFLTKDRIV